MMIDFCDYNGDAEVNWCEFTKCAEEAGMTFGCHGLCHYPENPTDEAMLLDYHIHGYCWDN